MNPTADDLRLLSEAFEAYETLAVRSELELLQADQLAERILDAMGATR